MLTVIFMLSPFTVENATVLVPRSHKLGFNYLSAHDAPTNHTESNELPEPLPEPLAQARAVGPEGGVIIFDSRLWVSASSVATCATLKKHAMHSTGPRCIPRWKRVSG